MDFVSTCNTVVTGGVECNNLSGAGDTLSICVIVCLRACIGVYYYVNLQVNKNDNDDTITEQKYYNGELFEFSELAGADRITGELLEFRALRCGWLPPAYGNGETYY